MADQVADLPNAVFVSVTSGDRPLVFESRHANSRELLSTLDQVRSISGVRDIRVTTYVDVLRGFFVARELKPIRLDALDHDLIAELQQDGRASYRTLADAIRLSPSAVRTRVRRLVDSGAIRIAAVKSGGLSPGRFATGLGIVLRGRDERVREFVLESQTIEFAARSHGAYDFVATAVGGSSAEVLDTIERIRGFPEVSMVDTWAHYDLVKEDYARALGRVLKTLPPPPDEAFNTI
ncbi:MULTISPECIES: Lrp/AsnC family transcriptional regulator [unclassified Brevibacterium]|uniref:Lrp/AsnC family transcriptional regulator n=1 Tax=unclassified Brevibacterium TaxID=2614124 RepID=UPI0020179F15|nr:MULTISPECIES: Lrp/AsnC family transcriptional regulator [unclassified Brevibacterium]MCM1013049.1 Lrp/AsnC family transcriptional regulator [Brevibacterium sp. XM4083]